MTQRAIKLQCYVFVKVLLLAMKKMSWSSYRSLSCLFLHQEPSWGRSLLFLSLGKSASTWIGPTSSIYLVMSFTTREKKCTCEAVSWGTCFHCSMLLLQHFQERLACSGSPCGPFWPLTVQILTRGYQMRREFTLMHLWRRRWCRNNNNVKACFFPR